MPGPPSWGRPETVCARISLAPFEDTKGEPMKITKRYLLGMILLLVVAAAAPVEAQSGSDEWEFQLAPLYLWAVSLEGGLSAQGRDFEIVLEEGFPVGVQGSISPDRGARPDEQDQKGHSGNAPETPETGPRNPGSCEAVFMEPTLHSEIDQVIDLIKNITKIKVAILTNGSLFWKTDVVSKVLGANIILPTLSSAFEETFQAIHKPHKGLHLSKIIQGLIEMRKRFKGSIFLEVMLLAGINDSDKEIEGLQKPAMPVLDLEERTDGFKEVELGFTEEMAIKEAKRCLRCDLELKEEEVTV